MPLQNVRRQAGMTVVMIGHDMGLLFSVADRITVMHHGRIIADNAPAAIAANPKVQEVYLGEDYELA